MQRMVKITTAMTPGGHRQRGERLDAAEEPATPRASSARLPPGASPAGNTELPTRRPAAPGGEGGRPPQLHLEMPTFLPGVDRTIKQKTSKPSEDLKNS